MHSTSACGRSSPCTHCRTSSPLHSCSHADYAASVTPDSPLSNTDRHGFHIEAVTLRTEFICQTRRTVALLCLIKRCQHGVVACLPETLASINDTAAVTPGIPATAGNTQQQGKCEKIILIQVGILRRRLSKATDHGRSSEENLHHNHLVKITGMK